MWRRLITSALIFSLTSINAPTALAAFPRVTLPVIQSVKFSEGSITLIPPTSNSPGAWSATVSDPTIARINGLVATVLKAGSTGVRYTQAASGNFSSVSRVSRLIVEKGTPTFGTWPALSATLLSRTLKLTPPTSNSTARWSYRTSNSQIATVLGDILTFQDSGSVTITAFQSASTNWLGGEASTTLTISSLPKTLGTFSDITIAKDSVATLNLIEPTSSSSGAWTFSIADSSIATLYGKVITSKNIGSTTITARQAASGGYGSSILTMTLTILGANATVGDFKDAIYTKSATTSNKLSILAPTSNSPGAWTFASSDQTVAAISTVGTIGNITIYKPGKTTITATQVVSGNYAATSANMLLTVNSAPIMATLSDLQKVFGDGEQTILPPTSESKGDWTYTSSNPDVVKINGQKLNFIGSGSAVITMTQAVDNYWLSASTNFKVTVLGITPTVGTLIPVKVEIGESLSSIPSPTSNSLGKWSYTVTDSSIAKVVNNEIVGVSAGTTIIIATQMPAGKYGQSNSVQASLTVIPATVKAAPTPAPKPSTSAKPASKPATISTSKPVVKVAVKQKKRIIRVSVVGSIVKVRINGKKAKLGKNKVQIGKNQVIVKVGSTIIFNKTYKIK